MATKYFKNRCIMVHHDTVAGATLSSIPGIIYSIYVYFSNQPVEKWVSVLTGLFVLTQFAFLIIDRINKRRKSKNDRR